MGNYEENASSSKSTKGDAKKPGLQKTEKKHYKRKRVGHARKKGEARDPLWGVTLVNTTLGKE